MDSHKSSFRICLYFAFTTITIGSGVTESMLTCWLPALT